MEGELKKRGANVPVMHDRYCVATWEIDQAFNKYVLLRSFKNRKSYVKHPSKPLSACTLKCFGDWDGKATFRRYDHAFLMETREGRVFLCAAPSALEKTRWLEFMSNRNLPPPSRGNSSSELRQLVRQSSSSTLNGGAGLNVNHRLSLQFLEELDAESTNQGGATASLDGSDFGGDAHSDTFSEYSPDEDPGCESPKDAKEDTKDKDAKTEPEPAPVEAEELSAASKQAAHAAVSSVDREPSSDKTDGDEVQEAISQLVDAIVAVQKPTDGRAAEEPSRASTSEPAPTSSEKRRQVETPLSRSSASIADAGEVALEKEDRVEIEKQQQLEPIVTEAKKECDEVVEATLREPPTPVNEVQLLSPTAAGSLDEELSAVPESLPVAEVTVAPAATIPVIVVDATSLVAKEEPSTNEAAPSTPKSSVVAASDLAPAFDGDSSGEDSGAMSPPPQRVRSYSSSIMPSPFDAFSTPTQRLRRYSFGSPHAPVRASHVFAAMSSPIHPSFMEPHLGYVQSGLSAMIPTFPEMYTSLSRQQSLDVQSEEDENEEEEGELRGSSSGGGADSLSAKPSDIDEV